MVKEGFLALISTTWTNTSNPTLEMKAAAVDLSYILTAQDKGPSIPCKVPQGCTLEQSEQAGAMLGRDFVVTRGCSDPCFP